MSHFHTNPTLKDETDKTLENIASAPQIVRWRHKLTGIQLFSDDTLKWLGDEAMGRLTNRDRGYWGEQATMYESGCLTEAALAICGECERRGIEPPEKVAHIKANIEHHKAMLGQGGGE